VFVFDNQAEEAANLVKDPESPKSQRAMTAMLKMKKFDIAELKRAYEG
jgi:predicted 3-demethylubiquinone-9 3-methyltransferase (glyoxalase superfamily)